MSTIPLTNNRYRIENMDSKFKVIIVSAVSPEEAESKAQAFITKINNQNN